MTQRNENRGSNAAFVHPWKKHEWEFKQWVKLARRKREEDRKEIARLMERFYPTVLQSATGIVVLRQFKHLQLDGADLAGEWIVDMEERNFRGYDARKPFFCYGLFLLWRRCANIARREKYRRGKSLEWDIACDDDPSDAPETADEMDAVWKEFRRLPAKEQEILLRKHCLGESSRSIGRDFDMTVSAVNQFTCKIRKRVRLAIESRRKEAA